MTLDTRAAVGDRGIGRTAHTAWPLVATWLLCAALVPAVAYGLASPTAYHGYPHDVVLTSRAQDVLTAVVLPVLAAAAVHARAGSLRAHVVWLGLLSYLAYSYSIYLIGWQQNRAFLLYAVIVTLSVAALLDGIARLVPMAVSHVGESLPLRRVGWFLVVVGVMFAGLWLGDVGPSVWGGRPPGHLGIGGTPYAVYVLDLTVALPAITAVGVMLVRRHPVSAVLGGVVLVKVTTLFTALWLGVLAELVTGHRVPFTVDMVPSALLLLVSAGILARASRRMGPVPADWLRPTLWPSSTSPGADPPSVACPGVSRDAGTGTPLGWAGNERP